MSATYHTTVLLNEAVEALNVRPDGTYVDATFGGGGHSRLILMGLTTNGKLIGFDQDEDVRSQMLEDKRFMFLNHNFRELKRMLRFSAIRRVDGILADLGVSSHQFDEAERGFSYRFDAPLDMRMNQNEGKTAADILNSFTAENLQKILSEYGEVRNAKTLAQALVAARSGKIFQNISDLLAVSDPLSMGDKIRYRSQVFQALRMEVNDEVGALKDFLQQSLDVLTTGGRLAVITFHSIEDRLVKNFMKSANFDGELQSDFYGNIHRPFKVITKKPIEPTQEEIRNNPRARSAKLRVAEKV
ncbi:MAG: 16S rRNA (cytosine(1402)-N(4))-methyltransferase RsmH [Saprospiraceae bacterium]|nr:16S rRNA (cytosine(1402)-N(4))-methyltransferase RsmH [Saprospiraceae bacterium]